MPPQPPYRVNIILSKSHGCLCAKGPVKAHGFNSKKDNSNRYEQKRDGLVCAKSNQHIMANISLQGGPFELSYRGMKYQFLNMFILCPGASLSGDVINC